ncbi:IS110 family transposase [uncultured Desulfuromonas sp.]|uniref:IS110 family transposase n=2 Tax=Desulfuromonas TaxID=890 RepID=UPI00260EDB25|nr:IS110 family transposase [uncultured Desulfuromonas sp.]
MDAYVGIDVGRNFHVYAIVSSTGKPLTSGRFLSDGNGFQSFLAVLEKQDVTLVGMEATGHYWRNLFHLLRRHGYTCRVLNPIVTQYYRRMSLIRHKTDALDAECIARYLAAVRPAGQNLDPETQEQLRAMARLQATLAEQLTATVNRLHQMVDQSFPEFTRQVPRLRSAKALTLLKRYPTAASITQARRLATLSYGKQGHRLGPEQAARLKAAAAATAGHAQSAADALMIRQTVEQILLLQKQEQELLSEMEELAQSVDTGLKQLLTIPGISVKSAAAIIGEVGDIRQFPSVKQLIGYVGCHPRFNSSGMKEGMAFMSKAGNKRLRRILWQCTIVAIRHNPLVRAHYEAKVAEGKRKMVAIGHAMAKLVRIVWAVLTYNEPFDATGGTRLVAARSPEQAGS